MVGEFNCATTPRGIDAKTPRTEVKCVKKLALLHEFDDNVAIDSTIGASITTGTVLFQAK